MSNYITSVCKLDNRRILNTYLVFTSVHSIDVLALREMLSLTVSKKYKLQVFWNKGSQDSSAGIGTRLWAGWWRFDSWQGLGIFFFTTVFRLALGPTQPPVQWVLGALMLGIKWLVHEAGHLPPSSAGAKNAWSCTLIPQYVFMAWCSVKALGQLYFYLQSMISPYMVSTC
jgi:hypothetical protein